MNVSDQYEFLLPDSFVASVLQQPKWWLLYGTFFLQTG